MSSKSDGEFEKETGTCQIDWENQIIFYPENEASYIGKWTSSKDKLIITYELEELTENLTFIHKETKKCIKEK